jgi:hypothetical protein
MPTISAYVVHHKEFKKISRDYDEYLVEHGADPTAGGQWEYGESIPKLITAFVIPSKPNEHLIFIDTRSPYSLNQDLEHELKHVYDEDHKQFV